MKDFLLVYRADYNGRPAPTAEEQQSVMKSWMDWIAGIANSGKLTEKGNPLASSGKVVKSNNVVTNGPYSEMKEVVGGYSIIKVDSYDDAIEISKGCPVLAIGGNVEIREVVPM